MNRRWRSFLAVLSVTALGLSCSGARDLLHRVQGAFRHDRGTPVSRADLRAALLSIERYGGAEPIPLDLPPSLRPLPLERAARILVGDRSRYGQSRRIRAIALLASAGLDRPEYREALRMLGADLEELGHLVGYTPLPWPEPPTPGRPGPLPPPLGPRPPVLPPGAIRERIHLQLGLARAIPSCTKGIASSTVPTTDPKTGVTSVAMAIDVKRPLAQLAEAIDPQSWDECSVFFDAAYVAKQVSGAVSLSSSGDPEMHPSPPTPGTSWQGLLFEHFDLAASPTGSPAYFKNLLAIPTTLGSYAFGSQLIGYFSFSYALDQVVADAFPAFDIVVDEGNVSAIETSGGWLSLQGSKSVKLSGGVLSNELEVYLGALAGEVNESVCCSPGRSSLAPPAAPLLLP